MNVIGHFTHLYSLNGGLLGCIWLAGTTDKFDWWLLRPCV